MIDAMFQTGTDKALDDQVQRPRPVAPVTNSFSFTRLLKAPGKGVGAGVAESIAFGSEVAGAFGQVLGATGTDSGGGMFSTQNPAEAKQSQAAREKLLTTGIDYSNEAGDNFRERAKAIMPDPETAHTSENIAAGLFRFGTKAVGYTVAGGFVPGATLLGFDEGLTEADRLKQMGVDEDTRTQAGAVAGGVAGVSVLIPMTGATAATRFIKGVAAGEGTMIGQAFAEKAILANAGYDKIANTFDPFDPVSLAVGLVPGVLGAKFGRPAAKRIDTLKTEADALNAAKLDPTEQARSDAFERSAANLRELEAAVKAEKDPGARLLLVDELEKQRTAARENFVKDQMRAEPDLEPAARVRQVVDAMDASRLTPDTDLRGMALHQEAIETAHEQIARGEPVAVNVIEPLRLPPLLDWTAALDAAKASGKRIEWMSPQQYLDLSPEMRANPGKLDRLRTAAEAGEPLRELPSLSVEANPDGTGGVIAQEGRHRATLYAEAGVPEIPVVLGQSGSKVEIQSFRGQDRDTTYSPRLTPTRTAAAAAELHAARELAQNQPHASALAETVNRTDQRTETVRSAEPAASADAGAKPVGGVLATSDADPGTAAVSRAASEVAALNPDTLVMLDGMEAPVRVGDLLAKVKEEAARDAQFAKLVQVAAECALTA